MSIARKRYPLTLPVKVIKENQSPPAEDFLQPGDFLILKGGRSWASDWCRRVRHHPLPVVYLKPIAWIGESDPPPGADFVMANEDLRELDAWIIRAAELQSRVEELDGWNQVSDRSIQLRMLRYILTRRLTVTPKYTTSSHLGFSYPHIGALLAREDETIFHLLDSLGDSAYLKPGFFSRAPFCNLCHSAFLHFMETCPRCGNPDIQPQQILHHYRCAHVGEIDSFRQEDRLVCPKCNRELRQLGTDYDRPADIFVCNVCHHSFQDADVFSRCFRCGGEASPEDQTWLTIRRYRLTALGEHAARSGMVEGIRSDYPDYLIAYPEFRKFLDLEHHRLDRYPQEDSNLLIFWWKGTKKGHQRPSPRMLHVWVVEMAEVMKQYLRKTDLVSIPVDPVFLILCLGTKKENTQVVAEKICDLGRKLFRANVGGEAEFGHRILSLRNREAEDFDGLISQLQDHV